MQLNLNLDLNTMSNEQRETVAKFIVNYPINVNIRHEAIGKVSATTIVSVPKPQQPAHSFADVVQSEIAQEGTQETTLTNPPSVPLPPVANSENAAVPAAPLTGSHVDLDRDGLPWDARIHSSTRSKIADGTWKLKRGITAQEVDTVKYELRKLMDAGNVTLAVSNTPPPPPAAKSHYLADQPGFEQPDPKKLFVQLVGRSSEAIKAGKITQAEINACCNAHGIPALPLLATRLELVEQVAADIDAIIASRA